MKRLTAVLVSSIGILGAWQSPARSESAASVPYPARARFRRERSWRSTGSTCATTTAHSRRDRDANWMS
jgi:hypothetical protein